MALGGIGGNGGNAGGQVQGSSALDRFQQARNLARKKLDGDEGLTRLADLLKQKQAELAQAAKPAMASAASALAAAASTSAAAAGRVAGGAGAAGAASYGRAGAVERSDPKPRLGRHIDIMV